MKHDIEKLKKKIEELRYLYNFNGPLHFTDFSNLHSIIKIGYLCGRDLCYANNIEFHDIANQNIIKDIPSKIKGCTRFYYVDKNNIEASKKLNTPVYLLFNEEILYLDLAIYTDGNADLRDTNFGMNHDFFNSIDWEIVFNDKSIINIKDVLDDEIANLILRKKQAELLIDEPVPIRQLKNIIFRCNADYKRACYLFGRSKLFLVEPKMFFYHNNYVVDYNIVFNPSIDETVFILHFKTFEPVKNDGHKYKLYDINDKLLKETKVNFLESDSTDFNVEVADLPCLPVKFKFWFYGSLCIEETIG